MRSTRDGLGDVGDDAAAPAAHLVAEDAHAPRPPTPDSPFGDDPAPAPSPSVTGVISITNDPSGTRTTRAEW